MAWSNESDSKNYDTNKGWTWIQKIPRIISFNINGCQLVQWPVEELESSRGELVSVHNIIKSGCLVENQRNNNCTRRCGGDI